jgi:uncharacterized membrane protein YbhN (UPF0104 family)
MHFLFKIFVTLSLIIYCFYSANFKILSFTKIEINFFWLFLAFLSLLISILICALRWNKFLDIVGFKHNFIKVILVYFYGNLINQGLPTIIGGDFFRAVAFSNLKFQIKSLNLKQIFQNNKFLEIKDNFIIIVFDRLFGLLGVYLILATCLIFSNHSFWFNSKVTGIIMIFFTTTAIILILVNDKIIFKKAFKKFSRFSLSTTLLIKKILTIKFLVIETFRTITVHSFTSMGLYFCMKSLGLGPSIFDVFFIFSIVALLILLPISIAGWGVRETFLLSTFSELNFEPHLILAASLLYGLLILAASLPGLFLIKK